MTRDSTRDADSPAGTGDAGGTDRSAGELPAHAPALTREEVTALLRRHGIMPTHQRVEIARVLFEHRRHLSADQILALVNSRHAQTSKATVYNTLSLFLAHKLVRELVVDPAKVFYDPNTTPHHHFYNVASGELTDFPSENITVAGLPPLPAGTVTDGVDIIVRTRPLA